MNDDNVASRAAVLFYGAGDFASQLVWTYIGAYLTIFYSDIVGFTPAVIATIMLGARLWDAMNDPIMGWLAERTRTRFGRFRPYLLFGSPALAIFSVLTFTCPFEGTDPAGVIWATITYVITGMLYTLVNIPYAALSGVMTTNSYQRDKINSSRNIGMNIGMIFVNALSVPISLYFSGDGATVANFNGYRMVALVYAIISLPFFLIVFITAKEKIQPICHCQVSILATFKNLLSNKYLMIVTLIMLIQMTAFMGRIAVSTFYVIYCLGSYTFIALFFTIPSVCSVIGSLFVAQFARKYGKRYVLMWSMLLQSFGLLVIYNSSFNDLTAIVIGCCIFGLFNVGFPMTLSMVADSVDYMELKTGIRMDGTAYATYGLATKIGTAIGSALGIILLGSYGYVANAIQTPETLDGINFVVNFIPAVLFIIGAVCCLLWDFDKEKNSLHNDKTRLTKSTLSINSK